MFDCFYVKQKGRPSFEQRGRNSGRLSDGQHQDAVLLRGPVHRSFHHRHKLRPQHESGAHVHIRDRSSKSSWWTRYDQPARRNHWTPNVPGTGNRANFGHKRRLASAAWTCHLSSRTAALATTTLSWVAEVCNSSFEDFWKILFILFAHISHQMYNQQIIMCVEKHDAENLLILHFIPGLRVLLKKSGSPRLIAVFIFTKDLLV